MEGKKAAHTWRGEKDGLGKDCAEYSLQSFLLSLHQEMPGEKLSLPRVPYSIGAPSEGGPHSRLLKPRQIVGDILIFGFQVPFLL